MMNSNKQKFLMVMLACLGSLAVNAQTRQKVGSNSMTISSSAVFEIESTTKGFLPPRMTTTQRGNILSPVDGLIIYNTDTNAIDVYSVVSGLWKSNIQLAGDLSGTAALPTILNSAVIGKVLTGFTSGAGAIAASDNLLQGLQKLSGNDALKAPLASPTFTGTPTLPTGTIAITQAVGNNTTAIATTAYTDAATALLLQRIASLENLSKYLVISTVTSPTGKVWMDKNLGASRVATSSTDAASYGDLYQWGRLADGHQLITSGNTGTLSSGDVPGNANFITTNASPYDWRQGQNPNLWQGVNGINNPCPAGFRLPTSAELEAERVMFSSNNAAGAFASALKLPMAGVRRYSGGSLYDVGSFGYYWSSTVDGTGASLLNFNSSNAYMYGYGRAYGFSVRCLKD